MDDQEIENGKTILIRGIRFLITNIQFRFEKTAGTCSCSKCARVEDRLATLTHFRAYPESETDALLSKMTFPEGETMLSCPEDIAQYFQMGGRRLKMIPKGSYIEKTGERIVCTFYSRRSLYG